MAPASNADSGSGDVKHLQLVVFVKYHSERAFQPEWALNRVK